jgi:hypothetical protein
LVHPFCLSRSEEKVSILHLKLLFSSIVSGEAAAGVDGTAATFEDLWFLPWFGRPENHDAEDRFSCKVSVAEISGRKQMYGGVDVTARRRGAGTHDCLLEDPSCSLVGVETSADLCENTYMQNLV